MKPVATANKNKLQAILKTEPENVVWREFVCAYVLNKSESEELFSLLTQLKEPLKNPFQLFAQTLKGISEATCLPFRLVAKAEANYHIKKTFFDLIKDVENQTPQHLFKTREEWVEEIRTKTYGLMNDKKFIESAEIDIEKIAKKISNQLLDASEKNDSGNAAQELRYQTTLSLWSCLEAFLKHHLISVINHSAEHAKLIYADKELRKEIGLDRLDFNDLVSFNFEIENRMGSMIFLNLNAGKIKNIRAMLSLIYGHSNIASRLETDLLYELKLRRNLIVHQRGIVDSEFKEKTGSKVEIGEKINVSPAEIVVAHRAVIRFGLDLLRLVIDANQPTTG